MLKVSDVEKETPTFKFEPRNNTLQMSEAKGPSTSHLMSQQNDLADNFIKETEPSSITHVKASFLSDSSCNA